MEDLKEFLDGFQIQTIISLCVIIWYFNGKIQEEIKSLKEDAKEQAKRTDKLYEMFVDLLKNK